MKPLSMILAKHKQRRVVDNVTPACPCPTCGRNMDRAMTVTAGADPRPRPGDMTICACCGGFARFDAKLRLEALSEQEETDALASELQFADGTRITGHVLRVKMQQFSTLHARGGTHA